MNENRSYNGDTEHDMWVDFTTHEYTGELGELFDNPEDDNFDDFDAGSFEDSYDEDNMDNYDD